MLFPELMLSLDGRVKIIWLIVYFQVYSSKSYTNINATVEMYQPLLCLMLIYQTDIGFKNINKYVTGHFHFILFSKMLKFRGKNFQLSPMRFKNGAYFILL